MKSAAKSLNVQTDSSEPKIQSQFSASVDKINHRGPALKTWPPSPIDVPARLISDMIYGTIKLNYPLNLIVDTPEFQRLRRIKQTGAAYLAYPNCEHTRLVHCLGVYHLARRFGKKLSKFPELKINSQDRICLAIAGLCHDIGHGPFSHIFDGRFLHSVNPDTTWTHEQGSLLIFDRICDYPSIRKALLEYMDERDFVFVKELIHSSPILFNESGNWNRKGRDVSKSFLYDIISNVSYSLDVDKYDYLLRDSRHADMSMPFNYKSYIRIMDAARPLEFDDESGHKYMKLCYAYKALDDLDSVGESRYKLYDHLAGHRTVRACERILALAFKEAAPHLKFLGDDDQEYSLANVIDNIGAFLRTDDSIYATILNSTSPELKKAREYIACLQYRHLPKFVAKVELKDDKYTEESMKDAILRNIRKNTVERDDIIVDIRQLHLGMGLTIHPMSAVFLYDHKKPPENMKPFPVPWLWLKKNPRSIAGAVSIYVYVSYEARKKWIINDVHKAFTEVIGKDSVVLPDYNPPSARSLWQSGKGVKVTRRRS